eukprot:8517843-Pyramimonas_sp.AAC.1
MFKGNSLEAFVRTIRASEPDYGTTEPDSAKVSLGLTDLAGLNGIAGNETRLDRPWIYQRRY